MTDLVELQRRGLYDPSAPNAADRLALLRWLEEQGATLDDMVTALRDGSLTGLIADRVTRPGARFDRSELARRTGIDEERLERIRRAAGFAASEREAAIYTDDNLVALVGFERGAALFGDGPAFQFLRTLGSALATVAEAAVSLFLANVQAPLMERGELALAQADLAARQMLAMMPTMIDSLFRVHAEEAIRRSRRTRVRGGSWDTSRLAVGFVDLVGFTPIVQQLSVRELASLVDDFEARAVEVTADHDARVVKLIGDEVMFVAPTARAGCEVALTLAEAFPDRPGITPRGGVAFGEVLARGGDYYGAVVNLASRLADLAIPHEILVTGEIERAGDPSLVFTPAGRRMLRGFPEPIAVFSPTRRR